MLTNNFKIFLIITQFLSLPLAAAKPQGSNSSSGPELIGGMSLLPLVIANSTYGLMAGGALFYHIPLKSEQLKSRFMTLYTRKNQTFHGAEINLKNSRWLKGGRISVTDFFDTYYGESRAIRRHPPDQIEALENKHEFYGAFRHNDQLSTKISWLQKRRHEQGKIFQPQTHSYLRNTKIYPDETTNAFTLATTHEDTTETEISPVGHIYQIQWLYMPGGAATSIPHQERFQQWQLDLRNYYPLKEDLLLATQLFYGQSIGTPSYLFRYRLGGDLLRGYGYSRFKGNRLYAFQEELRFPLWSILSGDTFVSLGDTVKDRFSEVPFYCYGFGVKVNLPPDYIAKVRFEVGFSKESYNVLMEANHAF